MEKDFSTLLKAYRKGMGWTQEEMAQKWSYSFETISAWERGKRSPRNHELPQLAKFLEISTEDLAEMIMRSKEPSPVQENGSISQRKERADGQTSFEAWEEIQYIYRTRTEFNRNFSYPRMFENIHSILATGISLNAITQNYSRDALIRTIIEEGCKVQLCFLDPQGKKCIEREEEEDYPKGTLADLTNVNICLAKILRHQIGKISPEHSHQIEIRIYDMIPRFNIYIVDDTLMTVQSYAYGRGEDTPTLVLKRKAKGGLFDFYASAAKHILDYSTDISNDPTIGM